MELFNELPEERTQDIEDFLTFIPIYESRRRFNSLRALLRKHRQAISGAVCMEAGAGKGLFAAEMADLGARKVIALERSGVMHDLLVKGLQGRENIETVEEDLAYYVPETSVDVLFHEFYGPLVLDETILVLQSMQFSPGLILPDGGRLWAMPLTHAEMLAKDPAWDPSYAEVLEGALISELVNGIPFQPRWQVFDWNVRTKERVFEFEIPEKADVIALAGEITHAGESVLKMWWTNNWPVIYTPVAGKKFRLSFVQEDYFTAVYFEWR